MAGEAVKLTPIQYMPSPRYRYGGLFLLLIGVCMPNVAKQKKRAQREKV